MSDDRPTSFDDRVMQYLPGLRKLSWKYVQAPDDRQDLVTDTIIYALSNWRGFREDGGFWNWLTWCMRGVVSNRRQAAATAKGRAVSVSIDDVYDLAIEPDQAEHVHLNQVLGRLQTIRGGDLLIGYAMGHTLMEVGSAHGYSAERARQITNEARSKLARMR